MPLKHLYWITSNKHASGHLHEASAFQELFRLGIKVTPWVWDEKPLPVLGEDEAVIVRTPWDYLEKFPAFSKWIDALPSERVFNPKEVLRWNVEKNYLKELSALGVPVIRTVWISARDENELRSALTESFPGESVVLKPVLGAGAFQTYRLSPGEFPPAGEFVLRPAMIQPFLSEIETDGERSLIFFGGKFSHAIQKRPVPGDYRVQESFGGKFTAFELKENEVHFAEKIVALLHRKFPGNSFPLYIRIDYILLSTGPHLMELELLEPDLYFHHDSEAADRFGQALLKSVTI